MTKSFWKKSESVFALTCLFFSMSAFMFIGSLVAKPKVLFGQSLTAITPSMFPSIVLGLLVVLCIVHLALRARNEDSMDEDEAVVGWGRGAVFFGIMTVYGLLMVPLGFITSSAVAVAVIGWYTGNRSVGQLIAVSAIGPLLLYLGATRLLAVSLPELNAVEIAIARILG